MALFFTKFYCVVRTQGADVPFTLTLIEVTTKPHGLFHKPIPSRNISIRIGFMLYSWGLAQQMAEIIFDEYGRAGLGLHLHAAKQLLSFPGMVTIRSSLSSSARSWSIGMEVLVFRSEVLILLYQSPNVTST